MSLCLAGLQTILITFASQLSVLRGSVRPFAVHKIRSLVTKVERKRRVLHNWFRLAVRFFPVIGLTLVRVFFSLRTEQVLQRDAQLHDDRLR